MQARSAALTGKPAPAAASGDDGAGAAKRLEDESNRVRLEREENERMVRDVEDSVTEFSRTIESSLKEGSEDAATEHERRRWEDGLGVEDEIILAEAALEGPDRRGQVLHHHRDDLLGHPERP